VNESQRRAFAALGIGPLWRKRGAQAAGTAPSANAEPVDAPREAACNDATALFALPDESGRWLFVAEAEAPLAGAPGPGLRADAMRLLERMLAALDLRPAHRAVALGACGGGLDESFRAGFACVDAPAVQVIVALGAGAARTLLSTDAPLEALRGRVHEWRIAARTLPLVVSMHPSQLLAAPGGKAAAWADLCLARAACGQAPAA